LETRTEYERIESPKIFSYSYLIYYLKRIFVFCFSAALLVACGTARTSVDTHPTTRATLWVQNAAEYNALTTQTYHNAISYLEVALSDSSWTASLEQQPNFTSLPPAVVLDVDETVLDNSAFQARMIKQGSDFDLEQWNKWVSEAKADAVPGALTFIEAAEDLGIAIFYVTNREVSVEEGTRKNLSDLGFPLPPAKDVILSNGEQQNWNSNKINRRTHVAESYRILMLFGDDLNDFLPAKNISREKRDDLIEKHEEKWGRKWHILPNPVYGSWEQALYNFDNSLSDSEKEEIRNELLDSKN